MIGNVLLHVRNPSLGPLAAANYEAVAQLLHLLDALAHGLDLVAVVPRRHVAHHLERTAQLLHIAEQRAAVVAQQLAGLRRRDGGEAHKLAKQVKHAVHVVILGEADVGRHGGLRLFRGNERLVAQVVRKGQRLDELLQATHGGLVTVAVDGLQVRRNGPEKRGYFGYSSVHVLLNIGRQFFVELLDSVAYIG